MRIVLSFLFLLIISPLHAKPLLVGIPPLIPPFVIPIDAHTNLSGFDIDIMNEICKRIDAECQFEPYQWDGVFAGLQNGSLDLGIGNITITTDLQNQYIFSLPYLASSAQYLAQKSSGIINKDGIKGKTVGVHHIGLFGPLILEEFGDSVKIKTYNFINDLILGLTTGEVDVIILDAIVAEYLTYNNNNVTLIGNKMNIGMGYGIVSTNDKANLIFQINQALLAMEADGTYLSIYNTYFFDTK